MLPESLLEHLADGRAHSRQALADRLERDEAALTADLESLAQTGLAFADAPRTCVQLADPIRWLDRAAILAALSPDAGKRIASLRIDFETGSTNRVLLAAPAPGPGRLAVALAEYQNGGRGRRGRRWTMPPGAGLALSVAWCFPSAPAGLSALSLAAGAAARRAIGDATGIDIGLKWPNDLMLGGRKLGGILVEVDALADGSRHVVVGIGINVRAPAPYLARVSNFRAGACDLRAAAGERELDRSLLAGALLNRLAELFAQFAESGFEPYRNEWLAAHVLDGAAVELSSPAGVDRATVCGIEPDGALLVTDAHGQRRRVVAGDVSLRPGD